MNVLYFLLNLPESDEEETSICINYMKWVYDFPKGDMGQRKCRVDCNVVYKV